MRQVIDLALEEVVALLALAVVNLRLLVDGAETPDPATQIADAAAELLDADIGGTADAAAAALAARRRAGRYRDDAVAIGAEALG
jgi:hypothetical protein